MIIRRALMRETLLTSGAVTLVIVSIFLVVRVVGFLREAAGGDIPVDSVLTLLLLKLITYIDVILPLMLFIAILMVLARWNRDNELTVLAACGIGLRRLLPPMLTVMIAVGVLVALFSLYLSPLAVRTAGKIEQEFKQRHEVTGVIPGVFMETRRGTGVYYVERFNREENVYENVFVYGSDPEKEAVVVSRIGYQMVDDLTGDTFLVLEHGTRYEGNPGEPDYRILEFERYALRIEERGPVQPVIPVKGMTNLTLMQHDHPRLKAELQWRLSKVAILPGLILFALAFSQLKPRRSRLPEMLGAFIVYFMYSNALGFALAWMQRERIDPVWGIWYVHAVFLAAALYMFARRAGNRPLVPFGRFAG